MPAAQPVRPAKVNLRQREAVSAAANRRIERIAAQPQEFQCALPNEFTFHNTGEGIKPGQTDPHWEIVASTDADSKPRPAEVIRGDTPAARDVSNGYDR